MTDAQSISPTIRFPACEFSMSFISSAFIGTGAFVRCVRVYARIMSFCQVHSDLFGIFFGNSCPVEGTVIG